MNKYCFVILDSLIRVPYLQAYLNVCDFKYDIIIWDRNNNSINPGADCFYTLKTKYKNNWIDKLFGYIKFSFFSNKILLKNDYNGIIVFTPNTGMLCKKALLKKYKKRYIIDIRDYWKENQKWFFNIEKKLVNNSYANIISSKAYESFLPKQKYVLVHNSQSFDAEVINSFRKTTKTKKDTIVLACIGGIKYADYDKKVLAYFKNDNRFELRFIGRGYEELDSFIKQENIKNAYVEGMFPISETLKKYDGVDCILNLYGNNNPKLDYALSNKLYISASLGMPILVCPNTYMSTISQLYGFGFVVDINDSSYKDALFNGYNSINWESFYKTCDDFLKKVDEENQTFSDIIFSFLNDVK